MSSGSRSDDGVCKIRSDDARSLLNSITLIDIMRWKDCLDGGDEA